MQGFRQASWHALKKKKCPQAIWYESAGCAWPSALDFKSLLQTLNVWHKGIKSKQSIQPKYALPEAESGAFLTLWFVLVWLPNPLILCFCLLAEAGLFSLIKWKTLGTVQKHDSFMLSLLLGKLFSIWSLTGSSQLRCWGWKSVQGGPQSKISPKIRVDIFRLSIQPEQDERKENATTELWETVLSINYRTDPTSSGKKGQQFLERSVDLDLPGKVQVGY